MKTILIACAMAFATIAVSTSAMASAVPDLDAVSVVNEKTADVIQVAKEEAYGFAHSIKMSNREYPIKKPTAGAARKRTGGRADFDDRSIKRKAPHYKRKSPRQCKKGQTASCK